MGIEIQLEARRSLVLRHIEVGYETSNGFRVLAIAETLEEALEQAEKLLCEHHEFKPAKLGFNLTKNTAAAVSDTAALEGDACIVRIMENMRNKK